MDAFEQLKERNSRHAHHTAEIFALCIALIVLCVLIYRDARIDVDLRERVLVPGPTVVVVQQHYRDRLPGATPSEFRSGFPRIARHTRTNRARGLHVYDVEAAAYAKAYANARRANALLGEKRYQEHA